MNILNFTKLILALIFFLASSVQASVVYTYTGNNFDTFRTSDDSTPSHDTTMNVTINLEFANALMPNISYIGGFYDTESISFSDGLNIIDNTNITGGRLQYKTDSLGNIFDWFIYARSNVNDFIYIETINSSSIAFVWDLGLQNSSGIEDRGWVSDNSGSWSVSPVPIPAAAWLFGSALLGFFGFSRRKAKV